MNRHKSNVMRYIYKPLSLLLLVLLVSFIQDTDTPQGWTEIEIEEIGSILIPPTIELRDDDSYISLLADGIRDNLVTKTKVKIVKASLTFQPKGVNNLQKEAVAKYARILISIDKGHGGEFLNDYEVSGLTRTELGELNSMYRESFEEDAKKMGGQAKLLEWYPVKVVKINGMSAIKIAYLRQAMNNPPVYVQTYNFLNYDERIEITLSYRDNEKHLWAEDFESSINSFRYLNKH